MSLDTDLESPRVACPAVAAAPLTIVAAALLVAFAISSQFFFQPFVWRNWPLGYLVEGWADVAVAQVVLALPVALALILAGRVRLVDERLRMAVLLAALIAGALVGDLLIYAPPAAPIGSVDLLLETLRVTLVAGSVVGMTAIWRKGAEAEAGATALRARYAAQRAAADANELEALRRQIEPHFLFNTLATVRQLQRTDSEAGGRLLARLLGYVRRSLDVAGADRVRLGDEVALVEAYLAICHSRMGERLASTIDVPAMLEDVEIPPLMLITLVENSIKHGLGPSPAGGSIQISARCEGDMFDLTVTDDGVGLGKLGAGDGIGLANTLRRLRLSFGDRARLSLHSHHPRGTCAHVRLPLATA